jgi:hypothetical protein
MVADIPPDDDGSGGKWVEEWYRGNGDKQLCVGGKY